MIEDLFQKRTNEDWKNYRSRITNTLGLPDRKTIDGIPKDKLVKISVTYKYTKINKNETFSKQDIGYVLRFSKSKLDNKSRYTFDIYYPFDKKIWEVVLLPSLYKEINQEGGWKFITATDI